MNTRFSEDHNYHISSDLNTIFYTINIYTKKE